MEGQIANAMATTEEQHQATAAKLDDLLEKMSTPTSWMHKAETNSAGLAKNTALLQLHAEDTASRLGLLETGVAEHRAPGAEPVTPTTTVVRTNTDKRPSGHDAAQPSREQDSGIARSAVPPPDPGMSRYAAQVFDREPPDPNGFHSSHNRSHNHNHHSQHRPNFSSTPKMDFPKFDGDDYQIWIDNCELYFEIYGLSSHMKVKFAALNMIGDAALWSKTIQKRHKFVHWEEMCEAVKERWGKSKHTFYMRQMMVLGQTSTVDAYTSKFNTLRHQILLEDPYTSEVLFVERYLAGLRGNIRTAVTLHCPKTSKLRFCLLNCRKSSWTWRSTVIITGTIPRTNQKVYLGILTSTSPALILKKQENLKGQGGMTKWKLFVHTASRRVSVSLAVKNGVELISAQLRFPYM